MTRLVAVLFACALCATALFAQDPVRCYPIEPVNGEIGVAPDTPITFAVSGPIDIPRGGVRVFDGPYSRTPLPGALSVDETRVCYVFSVYGGLASGHRYFCEVVGATDQNGYETGVFRWTFTTEGYREFRTDGYYFLAVPSYQRWYYSEFAPYWRSTPPPYDRRQQHWWSPRHGAPLIPVTPRSRSGEAPGWHVPSRPVEPTPPPTRREPPPPPSRREPPPVTPWRGH